MIKLNKKILYMVPVVIIILGAFLALGACSSSSTTTTTGLTSTTSTLTSTTAPPTTSSTAVSSTTTGAVITTSGSTGTTSSTTSTTTSTGSTSTSTAAAQSVTIDLTAQNMAFDMSTITVPAGASVTMNFTNKDNVPHNFALYTDSSAKTSIFVGQTITNSSATYTFTAPLTPGSYFFRCDVHPAIMTGTFIVQ